MQSTILAVASLVAVTAPFLILTVAHSTSGGKRYVITAILWWAWSFGVAGALGESQGTHVGWLSGLFVYGPFIVLVQWSWIWRWGDILPSYRPPDVNAPEPHESHPSIAGANSSNTPIHKRIIEFETTVRLCSPIRLPMKG
jgi:hypothetical protein